MRLSEIRLENFRCFKDQAVTFDDYTCLVGANGAGKSTVLSALNVFFRNTASAPTNVTSLSKEDFHKGNINEPVKITLTFGQLSEEAAKDLKHYVRQGKLIVGAMAKWDDVRKSAEVKQVGSRLVMNLFRPFFKAYDDKKPVSELKSTYEAFQKEVKELPGWTKKDDAWNALHAFEEAHPHLCEITESTDEFYGATKGAGLLDRHVQWVYVPAVKDATTEQNDGSRTALGQLLDRTIRAKVNFKEPFANLRKSMEAEYRKIVDERQVILSEIRGSLESRLRNWSTPSANVDIKWQGDPEKAIVVQEPMARISLGEDGFIGDVARLGHGMQRAFIVSMLQELAETGTEHEPTLLLGIEEPELYQHPPQARHIASLLEKMSDEKNSNTQVVVCTHSPYFVSGKEVERTRYFRKKVAAGATEVTTATYAAVEKRLVAAKGASLPISALRAKVNQIIQPSQTELFFSRVAVLVEGVEDIAYLATQVELSGKMGEWRKLGCHFILCAGKSPMARITAVAKELGIPTFCIFDADADTKTGNVEQNKKENTAILLLCSEPESLAIPKKTHWGRECVAWKTKIASELKMEVGDEPWNKAVAEARKVTGLNTGDDKNCMLIAEILESLHASKVKIPSLEKAIESVMAFATSALK